MSMKAGFSCGLVLAILAAPALAAQPESAPTPGDAKAMLAKAVDFYQANGREKALKAFNSKQPPFADRGLYVFCIGPNHRLVADGEFPEFVGQSADIMKDASGKPLGDAFWDIAKRDGRGELHYLFLDPLTQKMKPKVSFFAQAGQDVCGVGTYESK
jgi:cytochrome c